MDNLNNYTDLEKQLQELSGNFLDLSDTASTPQPAAFDSQLQELSSEIEQLLQSSAAPAPQMPAQPQPAAPQTPSSLDQEIDDLFAQMQQRMQQAQATPQKPQQPMYQQPQQPVYQQPQQPMYQQPEQPMYQQPEQPVYQQPEQPTYQQPEQTTYQQPEQMTYQQPEQMTYQQPEQTTAGAQEQVDISSYSNTAQWFQNPQEQAPQNTAPAWPPAQSTEDRWAPPQTEMPQYTQAGQTDAPQEWATVPEQPLPHLQGTQQEPYLEDAPAEEPAQTAEKAPKNRIKLIADWTSNVLIVLIGLTMLLGAVLLYYGNDSTRSFFGFKLYHATTNEMTEEPGGFSQGSLLFVTPTAPKGLIADEDIVVLSTNKEKTTYITHRFVRLMEETVDGEAVIHIVTKADAAATEDPPCPADMLIGKVNGSVGGLGKLMQFVKNHPYPLLGGAVALLLLVIAARLLVGYMLEKRRKESE